MGGLLTSLLVAAEKPPDVEGRDLVLSMLIVALIFLGVIVLGETIEHLRHRRAKRR